MWNIQAVTPLLCYGAVVLVLPISLNAPKNGRTPFLLLTWLLLGCCIWTCHHLNTITDLQLGFQVGMAAIITALHAPIVTSNDTCTAWVDRDWCVVWSYWTALKIANNPRALPEPTHRTEKHTPLDRTSRVHFLLTATLKLTLIYTLRHALTHISTPILSSTSPWAFLPSHHPLIRPLLAGTLTVPDLTLRILITTHWILTTIAELTTTHTLASLLFVVVLRADEPDEWPPLFGDPREAYSLRRFWGRFWHGLLSPSAARWGGALAEGVFGLRDKKSVVRKAVVAGFVFCVSGAAHAMLAWRMGEPEPLRGLWFYGVNFGAVFAEVIVSRLVKGRWNGRLGWMGEVMKRVLGFVWVFAFLVWAVPRLEYPVIFQDVIRQVVRR